MFKIYNIGQRYFFFFACFSLGIFNTQVILAYLLVFLGPAIFVLLEIIFNEDTSNFSWMSISLLVLGLLNIISFLRNVFSDAGIMKIPISHSESPKETTKLLEYKGETFSLKFCAKCKVFRSLRAHHCKICEVCVEEYDHHSQLISNCVGKYNRKAFLFFLLVSTLTTLELLLINVYNLLEEDSKNNKPKIIYSLIFVILSSFIFFSTGMMLFLQIYLISNGLTTVEYFKGNLKKDKNPFNEGLCRNWWVLLRGKKGKNNINLAYFETRERENQPESSLEINLQTYGVN